MTSSLPQVIVLPTPDLNDVYHAKSDAFKTLTFCAFRKREGSLELVSATANVSFDAVSSSSVMLTIHGSGNQVDLLAESVTGFGAHILITERYGRIVRGKSVKELQADFIRTRKPSLKVDLAICALQYELQTQELTYDDQKEEATANRAEEEEGDALNDDMGMLTISGGSAKENQPSPCGEGELFHKNCLRYPPSTSPYKVAFPLLLLPRSKPVDDVTAAAEGRGG